LADLFSLDFFISSLNPLHVVPFKDKKKESLRVTAICILFVDCVCDIWVDDKLS